MQETTVRFSPTKVPPTPRAHAERRGKGASPRTRTGEARAQEGRGVYGKGTEGNNNTGSPGATPTPGQHAEPRGKGASPWIRTGEARAREGRGVYGKEKEEKGNYGELQLAVCKRKYEGAELRHGRPKPAAANANSFSLRARCTGRASPLPA